MLKQKRFWIGIAVSVLFLLLFFRKTDFSQIFTAAKEANYIYVLIGALVYMVGFWFRTVRWQVLLMPISKISTIRLFPVMTIGFMANNVLPLRLGELVRAYLLGEKQKISKSSVLGTIVVERLFDGLVLVIFLLILAQFAPLSGAIKQLIRWISPLFFVLLIILIAITRSQKLTSPTKSGLSWLGQGRWKRLADLLALFIEGFRIMRDLRRLTIIILYSILIWVIEAAVFYIVGLSFSINLPLYTYLLACSVANLAISLPSSQGGIGPFEYFCKQTLVLFGIGEAVSTTYAIIVHATVLLPIILLGFICLWVENISLNQLTLAREKGRDVKEQTGSGGRE